MRQIYIVLIAILSMSTLLSAGCSRMAATSGQQPAHEGGEGGGGY
jgi:hypothetical protein